MRAPVNRLDRRLALVAALLVVAARAAGAQGATQDAALPTVPEFDKIRTPTSPAFFILGLTPTTVERPSNPAAVATNLMTNFTSQSRLAFPARFALEVAPYWLTSRPRVTLNAMERGDSAGLGARVARSVVRTFTVAIATADSAFIAGSGAAAHDTSIYRIGLSARTSPLRGHVDTLCLHAVNEPLKRFSTVVAGIVAQQVGAWAQAGKTPTQAETSALESRAKAEATKQLSDALEAPERDCLNARHGFQLDVAGAVALRFPAQAFDGGRLSVYSGWATFGYAWNGPSVVAVLRGGEEGYKDTLLGRRFVDAGGRFIGAWDRYALSAEFVSRSLGGSAPHDRLYRANLGFDVKVAPGLWLNTAFGRDFRASEANSLLTLANLQWNYGERAIASKP